ncbi:MAG: PIG-L family deacetylase [Phycisphaerae bacterium]|nr:PIG-L family deacetylase [Phycisphaerae bacterium]
MSATDRLDIIFTAPHPDDLEIGCGGWIAKLVKQGYRVGMIHMTNGEPTPLGSPETRAKESTEAAAVLGATHVETLPLTNRELMDGPAARYALATIVRRFKPRILVGFAGRTVAASPDHWQGQLIAEASRFYSQLTKWNDRFGNTEPHRVDHLIYRPVARTPENQLWPATFVVDIGDTIEQKLAAVRCYKSQFPGARFAGLEHWIRSAAGYEGGLAGFDYGELYALPRPLGVSDAMPLFGEWPRMDPTKMRQE